MTRFWSKNPMRVIKIEVRSWGFWVGWATLTSFPLFLGRELGGGLRAKLLQSCLILCVPMDCSPPGISVHRSLQARILAWVAMTSSRESSRPRDQNCVSYISCIDKQFFATSPPEKPWRRESCSIISSLRQSEQRTGHLNPIHSGSRLVLLQIGAEEMGGIQE